MSGCHDFEPTILRSPLVVTSTSEGPVREGSCPIIRISHHGCDIQGEEGLADQENIHKDVMALSYCFE